MEEVKRKENNNESLYKEVKDIPVEKLGVRRGTVYAFNNMNIKTVGDLIKLDKNTITKLGIYVYKDILTALYRLDIPFNFEKESGELLEELFPILKEDIYISFNSLIINANLKNIGINTVKDLLKYSFENLVQIFGEKYANLIVEQLGVHYGFFLVKRNFIMDDLISIEDINPRNKNDIKISTLSSLDEKQKSSLISRDIITIGDLLENTSGDLKNISSSLNISQIENVLEKLSLKLPQEKKVIYFFDLKNLPSNFRTNCINFSILARFNTLKLEELLKLTTKDFLEVRNFGVKKVATLKNILAENGLYLSDDKNYDEEKNGLRLKEMINEINGNMNEEEIVSLKLNDLILKINESLKLLDSLLSEKESLKINEVSLDLELNKLSNNLQNSSLKLRK